MGSKAMITRSEIQSMILSEVASAKSEISNRVSMKLTRQDLRRIVLEEAAIIRRARGTSRRPSLAEAIFGPDEGAQGMIYGGSTCEACGAIYEAPVAKCPHCGADMDGHPASIDPKKS